MEAIDTLTKLLLGRHYMRFEVGSNFGLVFDDFHLVTQDLVTSDETLINERFVEGYLPASGSGTPELIAKSAMLAVSLNRPITAVELAPDSSLLLRFENEVAITLPTHTPIVDWHWAITEDGRDPYLGCRIGCFSPGEISAWRTLASK